MAAGPPPESEPEGGWSIFRRFAAMRRTAGLTLLAVLTLLVGAAAYGLSQWRSGEFEHAEEAFRGRAAIASGQLDSILLNSLPTVGVALGGAFDDGRVQPANLQRVASTSGPVWMIGDRGRTLASSPRSGAPPTRLVRSVRAREVRITGARIAPNGVATVRVAVPVPSSEDVSGVIIGYPVGLIGSFVGSAIERLPSYEGARALIIDESGAVLAEAGTENGVTAELAARASGSDFGELTSAGEAHMYASSRLDEAPWLVALSAPASEVRGAVGGAGGWIGWAALLAFALTGMLGILLLMRVLGDTRRLEEFSHDLDRRREEAEVASRAKNEFISTIAHELRTPLAAIRMFSELMRDDREDPLSTTQRRNVEDIAASVTHMMDLLDDTMDIARVEQGRLELRPERISIAALAIGVVDGLHPLAAQRDVELSLETDASLGEVYLDPARVRQVMINYLSNALKFTPPGGRVTMHLTQEGPRSFRITVEDTGVGISESSLESVFTTAGKPGRPVREEDSTRGLGLALTKRIVEAMGGRVGVESELGRGSRFYAILPMVNSARRSGVPPDGGAGEAPGADPGEGGGDVPGELKGIGEAARGHRAGT